MTGQGRRTYGDCVECLVETLVQPHGYPEDERRAAVQIHEVREAGNEFGFGLRDVMCVHDLGRDREVETVTLDDVCSNN